MFVVGWGLIAMAATTNTIIQLTTPDELRGRVMSVYTTVFSASVPIGGLTMGAIASVYGPGLAIGLGGILTVVAGLGALAWGRRGAFEMGAVPAPVPTGGLVAGSARPR